MRCRRTSVPHMHACGRYRGTSVIHVYTTKDKVRVANELTMSRVLKRRGRHMSVKLKRRRKLISRNRRHIIEQQKILRFEEWCKETGIILHPHLYIGRVGTCADIGVVAMADIPRGTVVAKIPRSALLTSVNSRVWSVLSNDKIFKRQLLKTKNSWIPLLIALITEYVYNKESSFWWPYLSLTACQNSPGPVLQWPPLVREQLLAGTGLNERVDRDRENIDKDYNNIVLPFLQRHPELFKESSHYKRLYDQMVCFVMGYSFTDNREHSNVYDQTMMVPFVDLLNHHSNHHVELCFHKHHLKLKTVRDIQKGSEVMNTYGPLSNTSLLHVYGFTEEGNPHDVALIQSLTIHDVYNRSHDISCDQRWERLQKEDLMEQEFEVDSYGCPEHSLLVVVRLLLVSEREYVRIRNELIKSQEEYCLELLSQLEKDFLLRVCQATQSQLSQTLALRQPETIWKASAMQLCSGQIQCLIKLAKQINDS